MVPSQGVGAAEEPFVMTTLPLPVTERRALFPALIPAIATAFYSPPLAFNCYSIAFAPINISYGDHVHEVRIMFPSLKVKLDQTLNSRQCILYIERVFFWGSFFLLCIMQRCDGSVW